MTMKSAAQERKKIEEKKSSFPYKYLHIKQTHGRDPTACIASNEVELKGKLKRLAFRSFGRFSFWKLRTKQRTRVPLWLRVTGGRTVYTVLHVRGKNKNKH